MSNREIKFRAWDNNKMHYPADGQYIALFSAPNQVAWRLYERNGEGYVCDAQYGGSLMQYIGLKDMHGKEIYEGDIVRRHNENPAEFFRTGPVMYIGPVVYCNWAAFVVMRGLDFKIDGGKMQFYEVIGNIHENPELLNS